MNSQWRGGAATFAACVSLLACGSTERAVGTSPEEVGKGVNHPLLFVPSPVDAAGRSTWAGSPNELLLADAMAACMLPSDATETSATPGRLFGGHIQDRVFDRIQTLMDRTLANYPESKGDGLRMAWWLRVRNVETNNGLSFWKKGRAMGLVGVFPPAYVLSDTSGDADTEALREALEVAGVNFCLTRTLKEHSGLGSTFLMTKVEQRQLFQTIRERAQIAMLQLSNLFRALALAPAASTAMMDPAVRAAFLRKGDFSGGQLSQYAKDLSDLILWEVEITEKLSGQLMRSASAHDPLPGQMALPRDGLDAGSWRQRVLALLYGGDPLAAGDPGARPLSEAVLPEDETVTSMLRWPNAVEVPLAAPNLWTPQAIRFRAYLERFDTFSLVLKSNDAYQSPSDIDEVQSAIWLYRELEAKLRQRACPPNAREVVPEHLPWCGALDPGAIAEPIQVSSTAAPSRNLLAYHRHGLEPRDALQLVRAIIDIMPSLSSTNGFLIDGEVRQTALPGRPNAALVFTKPHFSSRSVLELAAMFGSRGRHRIPAVVDASDPSAIRPVTPLLSGRASAAAVPLDEVAALGAVPALAAAREALSSSAFSQYLGPSPNPVSLIDAAIGKQQVSIRPVERTAYAGGTYHVLQVRDSAESPLWKVSVTTDPAEPFWSGLSSDAAGLGQYTLYAAVDYPAILHRLADPTSEKLGLRTLDDLTTRGLDSRLLLIRPQRSGAVLSGSAYLPAKKPVVFFARRAQLDEAGAMRYSYKPLTGSVRLWSDWRPGIASAGLPIEGQYHAVGGSLSRIAASAIAVIPWNLSEPAVDAFGRPRGLGAATGFDPAADQESLLAYRDRVIADAKNWASKAQNKIKPVLDNVRQGLLEQIDVGLERRRELDTINQLLSMACGASTIVPSDPNNPCNTDFMTVNVLGNTAAELRATCGVVSGTVEPIEFVWQAVDREKLDDAVTQGPPQSEKRARCLMQRIASQLGNEVEIAKHVGCSQYLAGPQSYGKGSLAAAFLGQHQALAAYRSRVKELRAEGQAMVEAGKALDDAFMVAEQEAAIQKANAEYAAGAARIEERLSAVQQAAFELAKTNMGIKNDVLDLRLAIQKARFEIEQLAHRDADNFAVGQVFFGNGMSDANSDLEAARLSALDARAAVEFSMLLNLSKIDQGSFHVGSPSQWADQVYDTDLSDLRIVGLSQHPMNPEVLSDAKLPYFVSNLESFVYGYPGSGKFISIEGEVGAFVLSPPAPDSAGAGGSSWFLECPAESTCAPRGGWCPARMSLSNVCLSAANAPLLPKRLKVSYSLNSRGALGEAAAAPRVNSRWYRMMINTGVANVIPDSDGAPRVTPLKNCGLARPNLVQQCIRYSGELKYSVRHEAPFVALDADGRWQVLSLQDGNEASGRSAPTTQFIDPWSLGNSLDPTGRWAAFVNYQSKGFPLEGWYELTLEAQTDDGSPEGQIITDLTILPWIKVLHDSSYWYVQ